MASLLWFYNDVVLLRVYWEFLLGIWRSVVSNLLIVTLRFLTQLSAAIKDREVSWRRQKSELEEHYNNLIKDLHTRTQVCNDQQPV